MRSFDELNDEVVQDQNNDEAVINAWLESMPTRYYRHYVKELQNDAKNGKNVIDRAKVYMREYEKVERMNYIASLHSSEVMRTMFDDGWIGWFKWYFTKQAMYAHENPPSEAELKMMAEAKADARRMDLVSSENDRMLKGFQSAVRQGTEDALNNDRFYQKNNGGARSTRGYSLHF